jgi:hypothetical protein
MKIAISILIFAGTAVLVFAGLWSGGVSGWSVGEGTGPTFTASSAGGAVQEQTVTRFLENVQRRSWDAAYGQLANQNQVDEPSFVRDLAGADGGLRTSSTLAGWDLNPLHATNSDADIRVTLHWSTPIGPQDTHRDLKVVSQQNSWKIAWPEPHFPDVSAQVIPVNYLRWDVVSPRGGEQWGNRGVDGPRARIVSMNAVSYQDGSVVMGEAVNEDTVPAFVNVNATLIGQDGKSLGDESSFDKVLHVLLPKQVTPYRIDFPNVKLPDVKNVRMDIRTTLVPASADPVIGVMNQEIKTDDSGRKTLLGQLLNQSGQIVNVPHVIATFYDQQGKVIWVADGYVDRALYPETPEPFTVEVPKTVARSAQTYHVVVNQYTLGKS